MSDTGDFTRTPNFQLYKPDVNADYDIWGDHLNYNTDVIDGLLQTAQTKAVVSDTPPPFPNNGDLWFDTVAAQLFVWYVDPNSAEWVIATAQNSAALVSDLPPSSPTPGQFWFDSVGCQLYVWVVDPTSAQWVVATSSPGAGITEAPTDGAVYGRKGSANAWNAVLPLATGGTVAGNTTFTGPWLSATGGGPGFSIVYPGPPAYGISYFNQASLQGWAATGDLAISAVARASDGTALNTPTIGIASASISDRTTGNANGGGWAYYGTAQRYPGALDPSTLVVEACIANKAPLVGTSSYYAAPFGVTSSLWLSCGGELAQLYGPVHPASAAITIVTNDPNANSLAGTGGVFQSGIVFARNAISGTDGTTGVGNAISMARGHMIRWDYDTSGNRGGGIRSLATAAGATIEFDNGVMNIQDTSGHTGHRFDTPYNPDTSFFWTPASGLVAAQFGITSIQPSADLSISAFGGGNINFGNSNGPTVVISDPAGAVTARTGYLQITGANASSVPSLKVITLGISSPPTSLPLGIAALGNGTISLGNSNGPAVVVGDAGAAGVQRTSYFMLTPGLSGTSPNIALSNAGLISPPTVESMFLTAIGAGGIVLQNNNGRLFAAIDGQPTGTPEAAYLRVTTPAGAGALNVAVFAGTSANNALNLQSLGTGAITFTTGGGLQAQVLNVASAVRSVNISGAVNGGSPILAASLGNLFLGTSGLATNATSGFIQIPTCNGPPTGTPSNAGAGATLVYDATNNKLYAYSGSAWRSVTFA